MNIIGMQGSFELIHQNRFGHNQATFHDAAAALVCNGGLVAAFEEERFNRIKHTNKAPLQAIRKCLEQALLRISDIDYFVLVEPEAYIDSALCRRYRADSSQGLQTARQYIQQLFYFEFGENIPFEKIQFIDHHFAHAASAFYPSGMDTSLVATIDGVGDEQSMVVYVGDGLEITPLISFPYASSLGKLYEKVTEFLGYKRFDEFKVMGLAPYGNSSRYESIFSKLYELESNGKYHLNLDRIEELHAVCQPRKKDDPFTQVHQDIAAGVQKTVETILFHVLGYFQKQTGQTKLCLAGGVALNCTFNGKLMYKKWFDEIFIQPAANDGGLPFGAALAQYVLKSKEPRRIPMQHAYWGAPIGTEDAIEGTLSKWKAWVDYERVSDVERKTADLLVEGAVVGWVQGNFEYGPRALGNRSILADPRPESHRSLINAKIKERESYRPFALSLHEDKVDTVFKMPGPATSYPYMTVALQVRDDMKEKLGAVTHVDGSARLQTVSKEENEKYWRLIECFRKQTGIPCLLNTSFNNNVEPIVASADDAIGSFITTGLDALVIGDFLVKRRDSNDVSSEHIFPSLPRYVLMHQSEKCVSEENASSFNFLLPRREKTVTIFELGVSFSEHRTLVSEALFKLLMHVDGYRSLDALFNFCEITSEDERTVIREALMELWSKRLVLIRPCK